MAHVAFKGKPVKTAGDLPAVGTKAPSFTLAGGDLSEVTLAHYAGKKVVLNIFPSIDTPVCAASVRRFNAEASALGDTAVLCISADLPFAHGLGIAQYTSDPVFTALVRERAAAASVTSTAEPAPRPTPAAVRALLSMARHYPGEGSTVQRLRSPLPASPRN